jgi:hypothetical protein
MPGKPPGSSSQISNLVRHLIAAYQRNLNTVVTYEDEVVCDEGNVVTT